MATKKRSKKKTAVDQVTEELLKKEKRDQEIKFGLDLQEMFRSATGKIFVELLEQRMAISMKEACTGKHSKGQKEGEYLVQSYEDFCTVRGFTNGIQWVLDFAESRINKAKRLKRDREKEEKESSET